MVYEWNLKLAKSDTDDDRVLIAESGWCTPIVVQGHSRWSGAGWLFNPALAKGM